LTAESGVLYLDFVGAAFGEANPLVQFSQSRDVRGAARRGSDEILDLFIPPFEIASGGCVRHGDP
jgi:hypothetical protein